LKISFFEKYSKNERIRYTIRGMKTRQQNKVVTYGSGVTLNATFGFDVYGNQVKVLTASQTVWELISAYGNRTTTLLGGTMTATKTLDSNGFLTNLATVKTEGPNIRDFGYSFNSLTGNLNYRINGLTGQKETFHYDDLDRLTSMGEGTPEVETMAIGFLPNGNISSKTGLGTYVYDGFKPHAVALVDYNMNLMPSTPQSISYTAFNKAECLKDTVDAIDYQLDIMYGPDEQRWKSVLKSGTDVKTIIFAGDYEKVTEKGVTQELYYIGAPDGLAAVYQKDAINGGRIYYTHTDHLGSIVSLTDSSGVAVFQASYDAWGKQTVSLNTIGFYRGYTGHEHLPEFGLINMNGRMYDPVLGRFLSPDNYVQAADNSQNFNRYSYCLNNPLRYTDPSGEFLTWSFGKGGFSFGFNLTPIGIPLGAGLNFGWSDGFSVGGYDEVGYRVGGTGLGSGATVSNSLDYNFKHSTWSTTTSAGAYGSLGPFNAGVNLYQTYNITNNQLSNGWGVSAGIGIGNDASGLGLYGGYGSGGWTYGLGGYYNSKAWDSNPEYNPEMYYNCETEASNNCYSYAIDDPYNNIGGKPQPGDYAGRGIDNLDINEIISASIADGSVKKPTFFNKLGFGKRGYYSAYLVMDNVDGVQDYHWYRQDKGGLWSQKHGADYVSNVDGSGQLIRNPAKANHFYGGPYYNTNGNFVGNLNYNSGGKFLWIKR